MQQHKSTPDKSWTDNQGKDTGISIIDIQADAVQMQKSFEPTPHIQIIPELLKKVEEVDFRKIAFPQAEKLEFEIAEAEKKFLNPDGSINKEPEGEKAREKVKFLNEKLKKLKLQQKHYLIIVIDEILALAKKYNWGICRNNGFVYLYNRAFWSLFEQSELETFLGDAALNMGVERFSARFYQFRDLLHKQFVSMATLPKPVQEKDKVLINLRNGTFEISPDRQILRPPARADFLTYQLPFEYNANATAPMFQAYLNKVVPNREIQRVLAEFLGYVFIQPTTLKLEKTLMLYGTGANGKSVFFEIVYALLGKENVSNYSLQSLTNEHGYYRAKIGDKLVNYASEINGKLETSIFKQLVSGEPVEARLPYGEPFMLSNYCKFIFNANELPKEVEQTNAFFRRFLIVPFNVTIPENEQDKELSKKIADNELSGIFNWVLDGLERLLHQKNFTQCDVIEAQLQTYRTQSDSVLMFIEDENYIISTHISMPLKSVFVEYMQYCFDNGYHKCSNKEFAKRLRNSGFAIERKNAGNVIYVEKKVE